MKKVIFLSLLLAGANAVSAQKFFTKDGTIHFFSDAKMEKIDATNNKASIVLDASSGAIEIATLIKGFVFENAFMGEHFNETYMESDKFPKANFKGKIENMSQVNFAMSGTYKAKVVGDLTMPTETLAMPRSLKYRLNGIRVKPRSLMRPVNISRCRA